MTVPLYSYKLEFQGYVPEQSALKLERNGLTKLARHKKGTLNPVILQRRLGDPKATTSRDYMGKAYSWQQAA